MILPFLNSIDLDNCATLHLILSWKTVIPPLTTCSNLASLYIVRDKLKCNDEAKDTVVKEYSDILPSYTKYKWVKRNYTLGDGTEEAVNLALQAVSQEIIEFINTLYSSTQTPSERLILQNMIRSIHI